MFCPAPEAPHPQFPGGAALRLRETNPKFCRARIGAVEGLLAPKGDPLRAEAGGLRRGIGSWERHFTQ